MSAVVAFALQSHPETALCIHGMVLVPRPIGSLLVHRFIVWWEASITWTTGGAKCNALYKQGQGYSILNSNFCLRVWDV